MRAWLQAVEPPGMVAKRIDPHSPLAISADRPPALRRARPDGRFETARPAGELGEEPGKIVAGGEPSVEPSPLRIMPVPVRLATPAGVPVDVVASCPLSVETAVLGTVAPANWASEDTAPPDAGIALLAAAMVLAVVLLSEDTAPPTALVAAGIALLAVGMILAVVLLSEDTAPPTALVAAGIALLAVGMILAAETVEEDAAGALAGTAAVERGAADDPWEAADGTVVEATVVAAVTVSAGFTAAWLIPLRMPFAGLAARTGVAQAAAHRSATRGNAIATATTERATRTVLRGQAASNGCPALVRIRAL
jgi:hypothetical protein